MGMYSVATKFTAKDGVSPVFGKMTKSATMFDKRMNTSFSNLITKSKALKQEIFSVGTGMKALAIGGTYKAFADFESGITNIKTLLSDEELLKYSAELEQASKGAIRLGFATEDSNKALFDTVSALGMSEKTLSIYSDSTKLAKGGCTDLGIAVDGMTSIINAYGKDVTDSTRVMNAFFSAQKYGKTTVEELALNVGQVAPMAKSAEVGFEQLLATMSALTLGGLSTDNATTALKSALSALVKPSKGAAEALRSLGVPYGVTELKAKGLGYALVQLNRATKENPDLVAQAIPNIRAYTAVMALSEDKLKMVDTTLKAINDDYLNGTGLMSAYGMQMMNRTNKMKSSWGEIKVTIIEVGEAIAPILDPMVETIGAIGRGISDMSPAMKSAIGYGLMFALVAKPLFMLSGLIGLNSFLMEAFKLEMHFATLAGKGLGSALLSMASKGLQAVWRGILMINKAFLTNPWMLAITLVVGGLVLAYKKCEGFRNIVNSLGGTLKTTFSGFWETLKTGFGTVGKFIKDHFVDILLFCLGPLGWIIQGVRHLTGMAKTSSDKTMAKQGSFSKNVSAMPLSSSIYKSNQPLNQDYVNSFGKKSSLDINVNNNTPYKTGVSSDFDGNFNLNLNGAYAQ